MTLRRKTLEGLKWSFIDSFASQGISFVIGIILARLLAPKDFGLMGMLAFFIAMSQIFIDSGFGQALIRKQDCRPADFSTVFYFNLLVGCAFYLLLFFGAGLIADFFGEPKLVPLVRVLGLVPVINAFGLIQRTIITKDIDFKLKTKISLLASLLSGAVGIGMALRGFGVWSLACKTVAYQLISTSLFWLWKRWRPAAAFSLRAFRDMFGFGSKLLVSGVIDTAYQNIYTLVIGKYFSATVLGYYTRADEFQRAPSHGLNGVIDRVSYPALSTLQDDPERLKLGYKKLIQSTMYITFILMIGLAATADRAIAVLIGDTWLPVAPYLRLLCFVGMMYPLQALNLNMLKVKGRSDLFLRLEIIKKILAVPAVVIGVFFGIELMIVGMIVNSLIAYCLNSFWSGRLIGYSITEQVSDISTPFFLGAGMGLVAFLAGRLIGGGHLFVLLFQLASGAATVFALSELTRTKPYLEIKRIVLEGLRK